MPATKRSRPNGKKKSPSRATGGMEIVIRKLDAMQIQLNAMQREQKATRKEFRSEQKATRKEFRSEQKVMRKEFRSEQKVMRKNSQGQFEKVHQVLRRHDKQFAEIHKILRRHDQNFDEIRKVLRKHDQMFDEIYRLLRKHDQEFNKVHGSIADVRKEISATRVLILDQAEQFELRNAKFRNDLLNTADVMRKNYDDFSLEKLALGAQQSRLEEKVDGVQGEVKKLKEADTEKDGVIQDLNVRVTHLEKTKQMTERAPGEFEQPPAAQ